MKRFDPNNPRRDPELNRQRIAHHEAGHAVVAWAKGLRLLKVSIGDDDGESEYVETDDELRARLGERESLVAKVIVRYAGEFAQMRWQAECLAFGCDQDGADAIASALRLSELEGRDRRKELREATEDLVARNWPRITALAGELLRYRTLCGDDAVRCITSVRGD